MSKVIGIAGPAGSGKSTVVKALHAAIPDSSTLFFDSYPIQMPKDLQGWLIDGANFNEWKAPALVAALDDLVKVSDVVIFEAPLGRAHAATCAFINYLVFLDVPLEIALARFAGRELEKGSSGVSMLSNYLGLYEVVLRDVYAAQRDQVMPEADVILDGRQDVDALVGEIRDLAGV